MQHERSWILGENADQLLITFSVVGDGITSLEVLEYCSGLLKLKLSSKFLIILNVRIILELFKSSMISIVLS